MTCGSLIVFGLKAADPPTSHRAVSAAELINLAERHNAQGYVSLDYRCRLYGLVRALEWADSIVQGNKLISALCARLPRAFTRRQQNRGRILPYRHFRQLPTLQ